MENDFLPNNWSKVHHAYIISGADISEVWLNLENNLFFKKVANPDAYSREFEILGIDEVRELSEWAIMKPIAGEKKVAVIYAASFTRESQNALLKLFEEPPTGTYFFIIVPNLTMILPTLLSRVITIVLDEKFKVHEKFTSFLEDPISERLQMLSNIIKNKDKEKARNLIVFLEQKISKLSIESDLKLILADKVLVAKKYLWVRGASLKIILEYLAITLPSVKLEGHV